MNILSLEKSRTELLNILENSSSRRLKLKRISEFFSLLLENISAAVVESYLIEFIPQYIDCLKSYSPFGIMPIFTERIIDVNEKLIELNLLGDQKEKLNHLNKRVKYKLESLAKILEGEEIPPAELKVMFPVIEENESIGNDLILGSIDSFTIKISKAKDKDKFIVVPSENESDKKLEEQINVSWIKAKEFCKKYVRKISDHHEVIISFDEHLGIYRGDSVGAALVIGFIEELLIFYNSQTVLEPIPGTAFTGSIAESGKVHKVSKEIVEKKVEIAFYSDCKTLAVPKEDESSALYKLDELSKLYPKRNLRIVGVSDLDEILLRRDLVEIKKQKLVVRTGKFVRKNWVSAVVTVLLAVLFGYLFVVDWDDNPFTLSADSNTLFVKNRNGKLLWFKNVALPQEASIDRNVFLRTARIIDINNDGKNEVIYIGVPLSTSQSDKTVAKIFCCDYQGKKLWEYTFSDSVSCDQEPLDRFYSIHRMIDTITIHGEKSLMLSATSVNHFSSAIFRLNVETGKRLPGTMWCSGFVVESLVKDLDNDGRKDVLAIGVDNGFEDVVVFTYEIDTLTRVRLSTDNYKIKEYPPAQLKTYIRLPKVDFENHIGLRMSGVRAGTFYDKQYERKYIFTMSGFFNEKPYGYWVKLDYNLRDFDFVIDNEFRVYRDSLIAHGKLNPPFTDTEEYKQILRNNILYWKDGKWVKREELE